MKTNRGFKTSMSQEDCSLTISDRSSQMQTFGKRSVSMNTHTQSQSKEMNTQTEIFELISEESNYGKDKKEEEIYEALMAGLGTFNLKIERPNQRVVEKPSILEKLHKGMSIDHIVKKVRRFCVDEDVNISCRIYQEKGKHIY